MSIEAMKQALEALVEVTGWTWTGPMRVMDEVEDAITALRTAIKEAEKQKALVERAEEAFESAKKREWVGLTDEEIYDYADKFLYQHGSNFGIKSFGNAIEAKLKEKNL